MPSSRHLPLLVLLVLLPAAAAGQPGPSRVEFSTGLAWPQSGALQEHWQLGPAMGVHWLLGEPRGVFPSCSARYNYFDCPSDDGHGTHGLSASAALHGRSGAGSRFEAQVGAGVGGLWTTSESTDEQVLWSPVLEGPVSQISKLHGWGPTMEAGLGVVLLENESAGARATLRALWIRAWTSDTLHDQLTLEMVWGLH